MDVLTPGTPGAEVSDSRYGGSGFMCRVQIPGARVQTGGAGVPTPGAVVKLQVRRFRHPALDFRLKGVQVRGFRRLVHGFLHLVLGFSLWIPWLRNINIIRDRHGSKKNGSAIFTFLFSFWLWHTYWLAK